MTKSKVYLLDSNVLIALATPEHSLNARAAAWFLKGHRFATCPITQEPHPYQLFRDSQEFHNSISPESNRLHFLGAKTRTRICYLS